MHAHSNMPGKLLLLYALELVSNDPAVLSWLLLAVSNLGGLLLYLLVRDLFGDRRIALYALVLYLFVPAKLFFLPLMNTVTPVVTFACLLLFERWLQRASLGYAIAAAVSLYMLVFFEPVPLVIGALVALILARALMRGDIACEDADDAESVHHRGVPRHDRAGVAAVRLQSRRCIPPRRR